MNFKTTMMSFVLLLTLLGSLAVTAACGKLDPGLAVSIIREEDALVLKDKFPSVAALSVTFQDTAERGGLLGGVVRISRASDERSLSSYVIYWASGPQTKLEGAAPIATISKSSSDLSFRLAAGTIKPKGATYLLVLTKNSDGEMSQGVSVKIIDKGVPEHVALSISFVDENKQGKKVDGEILVSRAIEENDLTHYVIYWGSDPITKLNDTPIATLAKNTVAISNDKLFYYIPKDTHLPEGAKYLIVLTKNADGEMSTGSSHPIIDKGLPVNSAVSIAFEDSDENAGRLGGQVSISKAVNESDITDYNLYFSHDGVNKSADKPIATISKTGENMTYTIQSGTTISSMDRYLLVVTMNADGEMATGVSTLIQDKGVPVNIARSVNFTDNDINGGKLAGVVQIERAQNESDLSHYVVYWGASATAKLSSNPMAIATLAKTVSSLSVTFPSGTVKPEGATHLLVFSKNKDGDSMLCTSALIGDKGIPVNMAGGLTFTDTDVNGGRLAGTLQITRATNESDITHYRVYWGSNSQTKLAGYSAFSVLSKSLLNLSVGLRAGTVKPFGATHFLVFSYNPDGEMATGKSFLIIDKGVPVNFATSIKFSDMDSSAGDRVGGTVYIGKAKNESDITQYVVYWGSWQKDLKITTLDATGSDLSFNLPMGTVRPQGINFLSVYSRNKDGEMETPFIASFLDVGPPSVTASGISFVDQDPVRNKLTGKIFITEPANTSSLTDYNVYWGSADSNKLSGFLSPIATISKGVFAPQYFLGSVTKPESATHFLVYTANNGVEMKTGISIPIADAFSPVNKARSVAFNDTDPVGMKLAGNVVIGRAAEESDVTDYVLYWSDDGQTKSRGLSAITTISKTSTGLTHVFPARTVKPATARYLLVVTKNNASEMVSGVSVAVVDKGFSCSIPDTIMYLGTQLYRENGPPWEFNGHSCTGSVLASGTLNNLETPENAVALCIAASTSGKGTCCSMHLFGAGQWYLTDGSVAYNGSGIVGAPDDIESASWGRAAGPCQFVDGALQPTPIPAVTVAPTATPIPAVTVVPTATPIPAVTVAPTATPTANPTQTAASVASCNLTGVSCSEAFTADRIGLLEFICPVQNGTLSKGVACPSAGKLKGCQELVNGAVVMTSWAYRSETVATTESSCTGTGKKLVTP
ncbi:MAG: hypothetical protein RL189_2100 [Pseudomonadota bacterium]|jgi:hypothetical protein